MKKNIAVIAGGDSGEYDISVKSGRMVTHTIDPDKYKVFLINIRGSKWFYEEEDQIYHIDKNDFSLTINDEHIKFDCVFCAIHGTPGENGKMPAYFEMLGIPYTSSDFLTSALTFSKNYCNRVVASYGVKVAASMHFFKHEKPTADDILRKLSLPVFVKPNAGGSSVGMTRVNHETGLLPAIERAFKEDTEIMIEEFVEGRELTCGVIESAGKMLILPLCEIRSKREFFDFEAKYDPSLADEIIPSSVSETVDEEIRDTSAFLYKRLNCKGVVRFDYIYSEKKNTLYFLEVNTVPGLTQESIVPKMARETGISLQQFFTMMIEEAIRRQLK
ncbi:MAG TPA: D-alanine--D-alanine ligase [Bacteroidales bacterium]|nr:D-alanine--D-alanine ligase [Bacteroidales bacterium]HPR58872.1 D-alanine--D-alanine ligase [Bacteroidales bacterium]